MKKKRRNTTVRLQQLPAWLSNQRFNTCICDSLSIASTAVPADAGNNCNLSRYAFTYRLVIAFCALFTTSQSSHWSWRSLLAGWSVFSAARMSCPRAFKSKHCTNPTLIHITFTHRWWLTRFEYSDHALGGLDSPSVPRVKYNNAVGMRLGDENIIQYSH